jgi:integrase
MTNFRLRYVKSYIDRHGKVRHYLRRPGMRPIALPGLPGSMEFMAAYSQGLAETPRVEVGASHTTAGSVNAMVVGYMASAAFHNLSSGSKQQYRRILEGLRRDHGNRSIAALERKHVVMMLDAKAETPVAARDFLRCLRLLIAYAISIGVRQDDPTAGVRVKLPKSDGFRTWTEVDISAFEAAYPVGTKPRLALALLLGTAVRCSDVVRLGRGNVRNGAVHLTHQKTGAALVIPVTPTLAEAINAGASTDHVVFLLNDRGRAFTARGFSKWFVSQCERAGLKGLSAHGLRKAACRRLAEAGCSANEIAAISGHASLREVERYTRAADQARMARNAVARAAVSTDKISKTPS